jgi:hypothetical protein
MWINICALVIAVGIGFCVMAVIAPKDAALGR